MRLRPAVPEDADALGAFRCARSEEPWDLQVEAWACRAFDTLVDVAPDAVLLIAEDDDGQLMGGGIVGVIIYQPWQDPGRLPGFHLALGAVALEGQRKRVASRVILALINHLAGLRPSGPLTWIVDVDNEPCQLMWERMKEDEGIEFTVGPDPDNPYDQILYEMTMPAAGQLALGG